MMHRFFLPLSVSVAAALVMTGCGEQGTTPMQGPSGDLSATSIPVLSATGKGILDYATLKGAPPGAPGVENFAFTAFKDADGAVKGELQYRVETTNGLEVTIQAGRVNCVNDMGGGLVVISAQGTQRVAMNPPGSFPGLPAAVLPNDDGIVFAVQDNGEGATDQATAHIHTRVAVARAICGNPSAYGFSPAVVRAAFLNNLVSGKVEVELRP